EHLIALACRHPQGVEAASVRVQLERFYAEKDFIPDPEVLASLRNAINLANAQFHLPAIIAELILACGFRAPLYVDSGINRLVVPESRVLALRQRQDLFQHEDFQRRTADGKTETFMPRISNLHRDFNRIHYCFMANFWIPLHDLLEDEIVQLFPEIYRQSKFDMDNTSQNLRQLGQAISTRLEFGDLLIFHSEQLHGSPHPKPEVRRHSFDIRVFSASFDENRHYRYNFSNINNLLPLQGASGFSPLEAPSVLPQDLSGLWRQEHAQLNAQYLMPGLRQPGLEPARLPELLNLLSLFPFAEDRSLSLIEICLAQQQPELAAAVARQLLCQTQSHYFAYQAGRLLATAGLADIAGGAFQRALVLARQTRLDQHDFMPVAYTNPPLQLLPQQLIAQLAPLRFAPEPDPQAMLAELDLAGSYRARVLVRISETHSQQALASCLSSFVQAFGSSDGVALILDISMSSCSESAVAEQLDLLLGDPEAGPDIVLLVQPLTPAELVRYFGLIDCFLIQSDYRELARDLSLLLYQFPGVELQWAGEIAPAYAHLPRIQTSWPQISILEQGASKQLLDVS
ncbi:MAG: hypothetical protein ACAI44_24090, partial [Candidatus Sericytochromatia bacterium]